MPETTGLIRVSAEKTRPANLTAYTAGDVISESTSAGTPWTFSSIVRRDAARGLITGALLQTDEQVTPRLRLYLYSVTPTGALDDNGASTEPLYVDVGNFVGYISFDALDNSVGSESATSQYTGDPLAFRCASGDDALYGVLVALDAFTPASAQKFTIVLTVLQPVG